MFDQSINLFLISNSFQCLYFTFRNQNSLYLLVIIDSYMYFCSQKPSCFRVLVKQTKGFPLFHVNSETWNWQFKIILVTSLLLNLPLGQKKQKVQTFVSNRSLIFAKYLLRDNNPRSLFYGLDSKLKIQCQKTVLLFSGLWFASAKDMPSIFLNNKLCFHEVKKSFKSHHFKCHPEMNDQKKLEQRALTLEKLNNVGMNHCVYQIKASW
jgi:hypothetical protein